MKTLVTRSIPIACVFALLFAVWAPSASGIPAFARKYETACTTCHTMIPKRNSFGEAFRRNGYKMSEGDEDLIKQPQISLGAPAWKEQFPNAVWPTDIPFSVPFSAYVHQRLVYDPTQDDDKWQWDAPHEFELLVGGSYGDNISFYGTWVFFEKDKNAVGLKQFWLQFEDLLGPENAFNVKIGRMEPAITWGNRDNDRKTMEHMPIYDMRVADGSKWRMRDQQSGLELNGILGSRFEYAVGIVNGDKKTQVFKPMDTYFRVAYKFGGMGLDGSGGDFDSLRQVNNWEDNSVSIGLYGYSGTNMMTAGTDAWENEFDRMGVDVKILFNRFDVRLGWVDGTDDNPSAPGAGAKKDSDGWFVETDVILYPWLSVVGRYGRTEIDGAEKKHVTLALVGLIRANIRVSLELYNEPHRSTDELRWVKLNFLYSL
ncbi:MAG: hypothetical protein QGD92_09605 [Gammaproteobacteria bacterium]|nr:hypothetical protein [Gammaproteobacteria bacterium]